MVAPRLSGLCVLVVLALDGACHPPADEAHPPCGDEYLRMTLQFPGRESVEYCVPNAVAHALSAGPGCAVQGGGVRATEPTGLDLVVAGPEQWFAELGARVVGSADIGALHDSARAADFCPNGSNGCGYRSGSNCAFEVTQAARANGDVFAGRLVEPCRLNAGTPTIPTVFPLLLHADFRAHLEDYDPPDSGLMCQAFPDGSVTLDGGVP